LGASAACMQPAAPAASAISSSSFVHHSTVTTSSTHANHNHRMHGGSVLATGPASGLRPRGAGMVSGLVGASSLPPSMSLVAPNLYVGDESAASSLSRLRSNQITHVLNCTDQPNQIHSVPTGLADGTTTTTTATGTGADEPITFLTLGLLDSTADLPRMGDVLREGVAFIHGCLEAGGTCLVHCHRGISRSVTLAMAYLIQTEQRTAEQVFESMRRTRRVGDPSLGYWIALKEWEALVLPPSLLRPRSAGSVQSSASGSGGGGGGGGGGARSSPHNSLLTSPCNSPNRRGGGNSSPSKRVLLG
jgi:hypothetical protein